MEGSRDQDNLKRQLIQTVLTLAKWRSKMDKLGADLIIIPSYIPKHFFFNLKIIPCFQLRIEKKVSKHLAYLQSVSFYNSKERCRSMTAGVSDSMGFCSSRATGLTHSLCRLKLSVQFTLL